MRKKWNHFQQKLRFFLYRTTLRTDSRDCLYSSHVTDFAISRRSGMKANFAVMNTT